jgi:glycosyltransferase involved in cell wall biosynthesis
VKNSVRKQGGRATALMLLSNCFDPDPRVYAEARALVEAGYRVVILAWDRDRKVPAMEVVEGIEVERIRIRSTHGRGVFQAVVIPLVELAMIVRGLRISFDVVHAHDFDTLVAGYLLSRLKRKPLVYDSHEDYAGMLHGNIPRPMEALIRRVENWLVRRVNLLITVGETLRQDFERRGAPRSLVVGNWKELRHFRLGQTAGSEVRSELRVPPDALVVCFIANLGHERHIHHLVGAIAQRPLVHLVIGGAGPSAGLVEHAARRYSNIHYLGFVPPKKIGRYTSAADALFYAFDMSSPNARYSAPNKLFEALAGGCALISANFGEIGKILGEHGCGIILPDFSEASICQALDACSDKQRLAIWKRRAAQAGEETYNWSRARERLLNAYEDLVRPGTDHATSHGAEVGETVAP